MSVRWMAVQYFGDTLRLPIVNQSDLYKPFGTSVLERDIRRIVVNPYSDNPLTFVPENENAELRECLQDFAYAINHNDGHGVDLGWMLYRIRELGIEASE